MLGKPILTPQDYQPNQFEQLALHPPWQWRRQWLFIPNHRSTATGQDAPTRPSWWYEWLFSRPLCPWDVLMPPLQTFHCWLYAQWSASWSYRDRHPQWRLWRASGSCRWIQRDLWLPFFWSPRATEVPEQWMGWKNCTWKTAPCTHQRARRPIELLLQELNWSLGRHFESNPWSLHKPQCNEWASLSLVGPLAI